MADEQYRWLDPETAETLLRGEPLDAVDATARDEAERLAKTLDALSSDVIRAGADVIRPGPELPGEAAALAAFRTARADRSGAAAVGPPTRGRSSDAGLVRIGGPGPGARPSRWQPVRFGLTAVLALGMAGGVAVAATSGILPTPFGDGPRPVSSVTAAVSPDRSHASPKGLQPGRPTPDGPTGGPTASDPTGPGATVAPGSEDHAEGKDDGRWSGGPAACRDLRDGKKLNAERRRALVHAAGGVGGGRVWRYCKNALGDAGSTAKDSDDKGKGDGKGDGKNEIGPGGQYGPGGQSDQGGKGDDQGGADDGNGMAPGGGGQAGGTGQTTGTGGSGALRPLVPTRLTTPAAPTPAPEPTYSAL
ncbi:hypothetical protein ACWD5F_38355 [Streptomyces sp. NPDC002499]